MWPGPSGAPAATDPPPSPSSAVGEETAVVPEPAATVSGPSPQTPSRASRESLPRLPTWVWLVVIGAIVAGFTIVCSSHGSDTVFVTQPLSRVATTSPPPTVAPGTFVPAVVIPATPTPSMVDAMDRRLSSTSTFAQPTSTAQPKTHRPTHNAHAHHHPAPRIHRTNDHASARDHCPARDAAPTTLAPTTLAPTTLAPTTLAPTTLAPDGPVVTITGVVGPCRFGRDCLIAGFTIQRFDAQPTQYVCEFSDGSRYTFRFDGDDVRYACATGRPTDTITIEVNGVRSETFRHP